MLVRLARQGRKAALALLLVLSASTVYAQTATVTAAWDRNPDVSTAGYVVYYGTASGSYQWSYDAGTQVSAQLTLTRGSIYYVSVRAYNASVDFGPPSNEATIDLRTTVAAPTAQITATMQSATSALVTWQTSNAVSAVINGTSVPLTGSTPVTISATTTFTLVATSSTGATATQSATATVAPPVSAVPNAPTNMSGTVSGSRVTMAWRAPATGAAPDRYLLSVGTSAGGTNIANAFVVGNVLTVGGDLPRGRYYARVRAANTVGVSGFSNEVAFRIGRTLVSPRGFTVQWIGTTAVLTWTAAAGDGNSEDRPTAYVLEAGTAPGLSDIGTMSVGNVNRFQADIPRGTYYVRLRAVNDFGDSDPTEDVVLTAPGTPGAPTNLVASGTGSTVNLRWTAPTGAAATAYVLEAGTAPGLANLGSAQIGNVTQFSTQAPPGTYYVRVRALNGSGTGLPSNEVVVRK